MDICFILTIFVSESETISIEIINHKIRGIKPCVYLTMSRLHRIYYCAVSQRVIRLRTGQPVLGGCGLL